MSQKDLAEQTGLTTRLISAIVNNKTKQYSKGAMGDLL